MSLDLPSFENHDIVLCACTLGVLFLQEVRAWLLRGAARLATFACVNKLAPWPAPLGADEFVQHLLWPWMGGGVLRCFNVYAPPSVGESLASAVARTCVVEAMRAPQVPTVVCGDFGAELAGHPLDVIFQRHSWGSPLA